MPQDASGSAVSNIWLSSAAFATGRGHALIGRAVVTFCSWYAVIAIVRRGPVRGPSHPCEPCN
jgi:hypothetical protein